MQGQIVTSSLNFAKNHRSMSYNTLGRAPRPSLDNVSIVEAERRGNLVIASLAVCLFGGVFAMAMT